MSVGAIPGLAFVVRNWGMILGRVIAIHLASKRAWLPLAVTCGLALALIRDAAPYRLPRSNPDVRLARDLFDGPGRPMALAVEQAWRMKGHQYLPPLPLVDLDPGLVGEDGYL